MTENNPFKVLLIDDSEIVGARVLELLSAIPGIEVIGQAKTLREGLSLSTEMHPRIIFLDINLPDGLGIDLLKGLKNSQPYIWVIMLTNSSNEFYKRKCTELGADFFLDKTQDFPLIAELIERIAT